MINFVLTEGGMDVFLTGDLTVSVEKIGEVGEES